MKGAKGVAGLGLPMRGIHDTTEQRKPYDVNKVMQEDLKLIDVMQVLAREETNPIAKKTLTKVTSRLIELTSRAHTRGHWTGSE